jgi:nitrate reductase gamma subunit
VRRRVRQAVKLQSYEDDHLALLLLLLVADDEEEDECTGVII